MHPPQLLNQIPHILDIRTQPLAYQLLLALVQVQKPLNHLAVYEPIRTLALSSLVSKRPPKVKRQISGCLDVPLQP